MSHRNRLAPDEGGLAPVEESDIAGTDFAAAGMKQENRKSGSLPCNG